MCEHVRYRHTTSAGEMNVELGWSSKNNIPPWSINMRKVVPPTLAVPCKVQPAVLIFIFVRFCQPIKTKYIEKHVVIKVWIGECGPLPVLGALVPGLVSGSGLQSLGTHHSRQFHPALL